MSNTKSAELKMFELTVTLQYLTFFIRVKKINGFWEAVKFSKMLCARYVSTAVNSRTYLIWLNYLLLRIPKIYDKKISLSTLKYSSISNVIKTKYLP